jgi:hypothetical protein
VRTLKRECKRGRLRRRWGGGHKEAEIMVKTLKGQANS